MVPVEILGKEKVENVNVNFLDDTVRENKQTAQGRTTDLNGTINFGKLATVNPNLAMSLNSNSG